MTLLPRTIALMLAVVCGIASSAQAQAPAGRSTSRGTVVWTIAGAGGGFGIGLWAGLTKFDDSINSDRKVWTTAIIGAAAGAVSGYFIGRSRSEPTSPASPARTVPMGPPAQLTWPRHIGVGRNIVATPHGVS
jgi:peptidoglycan/LPS O-acetylase OafA/YrhL